MSVRTRIDTTAATLWASAFVIAALVLMQAGRLHENRAMANDSVTHGDYSMLTASMGTGGDADPDELLYVIDGREGALLVYEIEDARKRQVTLRDFGPLKVLFGRARR